MITFFGIIVFIIPFILTTFFKDKVVGFLSIFTFSVFIHMLVAFVTQLLGIFKYEIIIGIYLLLDLVVLAFYFKKNGLGFKLKYNFSDFVLSKNKFFTIVTFAILFFELFSVHFNFSGVVNTYGGMSIVDNGYYVYPYFSDEWIAIDFVKYAISSHSLPMVNPLMEAGSFRDPLVVYFSSLSDVFLSFGLDPLSDFTTVSLFVSFFICILFYLLLKSLDIDRRVAMLTVLIIPYITNGGNLPGIWFLIPMIFSLIFFLIILIAYARDNKKLLFLSSLVCLCLYPPFVVFVMPVILVLILRDRKGKSLLKNLLILFGVLFFATLLIGLIVFRSLELSNIEVVLNRYLFRSNLVNGILHFPITVVLPIFVLPFALAGIWFVLRKKLYFIFWPTLVGLIYWLAYVDTEKVLIIDYPRIVVITSFLILILFALSIDYLRGKFIKDGLMDWMVIVYLLISIYFAPMYTKNTSWQGLLIHPDSAPAETLIHPASPASSFLTDDDIKLFSGFSKKNFLSPPWKGLVISAATNNFPFATKPSTLGVFTLNYPNFMRDGCNEKRKTASDFKLDYIYSTKFDCPNFTQIGLSWEGLFLYKFNN